MHKYSVDIKKVQRHSDDVVTLYFTLPGGKTLDYTAGQYVTVYFDGASTAEGKAYSLSSAPHEKLMSITVKRIGEYSGLLHALKPGDKMTISEPYGFFNPNSDNPLVCLGAGVGIAPILSILKHEYQSAAGRIAHLFYTNKTEGDIAHHSEISNIDNKTALQVKHHITRQDKLTAGMHHGRINLDECVAVAEDAVYLLCGSVDFVRSMWQGLLARGISPDYISTETFFE